MKLAREEVIKVIIESLKAAQQDIVDESDTINENTQPIGDLTDFDSLTSVEVTVHCLTALGFSKPPSFPSLFISKSNKALTVTEAADRILKLNKSIQKG